jgi:hypothetical protein
MGLLDSSSRSPASARTVAGSIPDVAHLREGVADCGELQPLLALRCPGAEAGATEVAAMVAICFAGGDASRLVVFSFSHGGRPAGFVVALAEKSTVEAHVGRFSIARREGLRLRIPGELAVVWDERVLSFSSALPTLVDVICAPGEPMLVLQAAIAGGRLEQLARSSKQAHARIMRTAEEPCERFWAVTDLSFDKFFATFSGKSRESFRQSQRKLGKAMDGQVRLECYRRPEEVEKFFAIAEGISRQTYQWQQLGLGMSNHDFILNRLHTAARLGIMRCHVLYCRDQPVAFSEGFSAGGVFLAFQTGYLPEMSKLSVGTVQTLEIIKEILGAGGARWCFDWQSGGGDYKRRISNVTAVESTYYLLPRGLRWTFFSSCLEIAHGCNLLAKRVRRTRAAAHSPLLGAALPALQLIEETTRIVP